MSVAISCNDCYYSMQNCHDAAMACEDETGICSSYEPAAGEVKVAQVMSWLIGSDRLRIFDGKEIIYTGYASLLPKEQLYQIKDKTVESYRCHIDIKHKEWEKRGLMPPIQPDELAEYRFSDLQLSLYYEIYI